MKFDNTDHYHAQFDGIVAQRLAEIRAIIKSAAPNAQEVISYNMPAFKMKKVLVYYAGYKGHIGFYPSGTGIEAFKGEFGDYKFSKGAVQFPLDKPLPADLIQRIVAFRIAQDSAGK